MVILDLTREERKVILFIAILALLSLGTRLSRKANPVLNDIKVQAEDACVKIDINEAGYQQLLGIKGIGPALAGNIITYREGHGPFREPEELKEVKGIGEFKYNLIKEYITIK